MRKFGKKFASPAAASGRGGAQSVTRGSNRRARTALDAHGTPRQAKTPSRAPPRMASASVTASSSAATIPPSDSPRGHPRAGASPSAMSPRGSRRHAIARRRVRLRPQCRGAALVVTPSRAVACDPVRNVATRLSSSRHRAPSRATRSAMSPRGFGRCDIWCAVRE